MDCCVCSNGARELRMTLVHPSSFQDCWPSMVPWQQCCHCKSRTPFAKIRLIFTSRKGIRGKKEPGAGYWVCAGYACATLFAGRTDTPHPYGHWGGRRQRGPGLTLLPRLPYSWVTPQSQVRSSSLIPPLISSTTSPHPPPSVPIRLRHMTA